MFETIYEKQADGYIVGYRTSGFGRVTKTTGFVSRRIRDAFDFHRCERLKDDGFNLTPMDAPVRVVTREVVHYVPAQREVVRVVRHESDEVGAAAAGAVAGLLFGLFAGSQRR